MFWFSLDSETVKAFTNTRVAGQQTGTRANSQYQCPQVLSLGPLFFRGLTHQPAVWGHISGCLCAESRTGDQAEGPAQAERPACDPRFQACASPQAPVKPRVPGCLSRGQVSGSRRVGDWGASLA